MTDQQKNPEVDKEKEEFVSAFISMFLLIALAVYVALNFYFRGMF